MNRVIQSAPQLGPLGGSKNLADTMNNLYAANANNDVITPNGIRQQLGQPPEQPLGATPLLRFLYALKYEYRGVFQWHEGTSPAFRNWLASPNAAAVIPLRSEIK